MCEVLYNKDYKAFPNAGTGKQHPLEQNPREFTDAKVAGNCSARKRFWQRGCGTGIERRLRSKRRKTIWDIKI